MISRRGSCTPSTTTRGKNWEGGSLALSTMSRFDFGSNLILKKNRQNRHTSIMLMLMPQWNGAGQRNGPMLRSEAHQNQEAWAKGEGGALIFLAKILLGEIQNMTWRNTKYYLEKYKILLGEIQNIPWRNTKYSSIRISYFSCSPGCGGDQLAEEVFKSSHYPLHRSLWKSRRGDHYHLFQLKSVSLKVILIMEFH